MPLSRLWTPALALVLLAALAATPSAQSLQQTLDGSGAGGPVGAFGAPNPSAAPPPAWSLKMDATARSLVLGGTAALHSGVPTYGRAGSETLDLLVQTVEGASLRGWPGAEVRAVVGDISVVRVPVTEIAALAASPSVRFIEVSQIRQPLNDTGRADIRADVVQAGGGGLPQAYRGEGVVVGVLDSGLDVTHPDFFDAGGSRVQFLLEFLQGGGQAVYTKAQIDANPGGIPERDGNGGQGHGTHVTGSAAGGGVFDPAMRGVAPASDIVFVKGVRHPDSQGGFGDADVIAGTDFIFQRAAELGKPAVVNLSLGGHIGSPHDGTSLYEQALSGLTGPGRIVVAAVGNDGFKLVHAGAQVPGNAVNETLVLPDNPNTALVEMWYDANTQNQFAISAYANNGGQLQFLDLAYVDAGQVLGNNGQPVPFVVQGTQIGSVLIDASATQDPRNGDGNVFFAIVGGNGIDIRNIVWSIGSFGPTGGRVDSWISGGDFYGSAIGLGSNEVPGDLIMSVGTPSTALGVIGIGSHVTNNDWVDLDGQARQWRNPNPNRDPNAPPVVPQIGQISYFSSHGPTRDGRLSPDVTAPGEFIFSPLSSHVTVGQGVQRSDIRQGGRYRGFQGTSMASPHATGTVALMLQVDASLTPADARQILQSTARADGFTGQLPNNFFGSGKADALSAVLRTIQLCGSGCGGGGGSNTVSETEPNNSPTQAQPVRGASPGAVTVNGQAAASDLGEIVISYTDGSSDDIEDLFRVTTTGQGLTLTLGGYSEDLDLFLLSGNGSQVIDLSTSISSTETISAPTLPAGTYLVGVSFYDANGESGSTAYSLVVDGPLAVDGEDGPSGIVALHPTAPNPTRGATEVSFELAEASDAAVTVYDVLGREVARLASGPHAAGTHLLTLDASVLSTGVYVVRLATDDAVRTRTLVVAR